MEETSEELDSPAPPKELVYQDVLNLVVGDYGHWQLKVVLLLWIPMFFCGTQFVTTDFMAWEPKLLFCEDRATCTSYDPVIFPSNLSGSRRESIIETTGDRYKKIFPNISMHFLEDVTEMGKLMAIAEPFCRTYKPSVRADNTCYFEEPTA